VLVSLSVALAFFHLLPLPSLDGGRMLFLVFEAVSRRKVPARVETVVHAVGFLALLWVVLTVALANVRQHLPAGPAAPSPSLADGGTAHTPAALPPDAGAASPTKTTEALDELDGGLPLLADDLGE
jgi:regulator of sigma E protease